MRLRMMTMVFLAVIAVPASAQQSLPVPVKPLPPVIRPLPLPPLIKPPASPAKPAPGLKLPYRTTTPAIEVIGSPNLPPPLKEFAPVRLTTSPIEVLGSPDLPASTPAFRPVRLTTPPIEVVGSQE